MLPLENEVKETLSIVILCAGEGTRLKKFTKTIPKPLLKIEQLNNTSILHHTINDLISLNIKKIGIVIGYLGDTIIDFISTLKKNNPSLEDKLIIIDTENQYKLGPLYSFLSIIKNENFFTSRNYYLTIPGDTIFDYNLLKEILSKISNNFDLLRQHSFVFYKKIGLEPLKELYNINRTISNAEITKLGSESILKRIYQYKIKKFTPEIVLNQILPITILNYDLINEILKLSQQKLNRTIWETLNHLIFKGKKIFAFEIESKYDFYDVDYLYDLK